MTFKINIELTSKRKPSRALIMRTIAEYLKHGVTDMELNWGENWIELQQQRINGQWCGFGWIKDIGGDDIAQELNQLAKQASRQFLKDHVSFVVIN